MVAKPAPETGRCAPGCPGAQPVDRIVFIGPRLPATEGGSTAIIALSDALSNRGFAVSHISIFPGDQTPIYPTCVVLKHEALHRRPLLRGQSHNPLCWIPLAPLVLFKKFDRFRHLRMLRRHFERLDSRTAVIFTHVNAKRLVDESGYSRERQVSQPVFIGQHHSQFSSLVDEPALASTLPSHFADLDAFVALTDEDAAEFQTVLPVPCIGIPNPSAPTSVQSNHDTHIAVVLARFSHEKQLPLLVGMFVEATATEDLSNWTLEIYGSGEEEAAILEAIDDLDAHDRIHIMGVTHDVSAVYSRSTLNLLASSLEGFGMTIVEAAQVGVPTIAFDCSPGVHGLLSGGAGYLVPPQNRDAYVATLTQCMRHRAHRVRAGVQARARVESLAPDLIADRWMSLLSPKD